MSERRDVVIIGAGFAGLGMAIRLLATGRDDFVVLEQAGSVGGTWRDNTYPGAACDVESHLYSFSFAPNPDWTRQFAPQPEILQYLERCADAYRVRPHLRLGTRVTALAWDAAAGRWLVETAGGARYSARVVVSGTGGLSRPSLPDISGLGSFAGHVFHSARWDDRYPLDGKTVAVVGTGASAVQIVPSIAPRVAALHVYQRTPPWILPKSDRAIGPVERALFRRVPATQRLARLGQYLWHELFAFGFVVDPRILAAASRLARRHLERSIADETLRARLVPKYTMGCKRVLLSNDYYPALARRNVELVTDGIAEVSPRGIVTADGRERAADAIVLATGFQASEALAPFPVRGAGGRLLDEAWQGGAEAYLGTTVAGFPNLFFIVGPNTGLGHSSMVYMIESQVAYIVDALRTMQRRRARSVEVRPEAQSRFNARLRERLGRTVWATGGCRSWYLTSSGRNTTLWPGFTFEYRLRTRRFDEKAYRLEA